MGKIKIKRNPNGDTRTAPKDITFEQFHEANLSHIRDVGEIMTTLGYLLEIQGQQHDWTKLKYERNFWLDFQNSLLRNEDFVSAWWYQLHVNTEKHHPLSYCHDNITLLDIIETIVDCVCAGKTRSGEVRPLEFNQEILEKAVKNTVKLIDDITEVVD